MSLVITLIQNLANDVCSQLEHEPNFTKFYDYSGVIGDYDYCGGDDDINKKIVLTTIAESHDVPAKFRKIAKKIKKIYQLTS